MNNGKSNGDGSVASKVLSPSHRSAAAATSGTSPVLVLAGVGGQQSASDAEHAGGSLRMDDGAVEGEGSRPPPSLHTRLRRAACDWDCRGRGRERRGKTPSATLHLLRVSQYRGKL